MDFSIYYNKISNCGHDEYGRYSGGKAGDQTGTQWHIISFYKRPWSCVLRHPDQKVRQKIAELGIKAAKNNNIGYDQGQRSTYQNYLFKANYDPSKITVKCETDCSAGVIAHTKAVGYLLNNSKLKSISATYTGNMRAAFRAAGFQVLTNSKYLTSSDYLMPGDILLNDRYHVATNLGIGKKVQYKKSQPASDKVNDLPTKKGVVTATALNVRSWAGTEYDNIKSIPIIYKDKIVQICDTVKDVKGKKWYYIRIDKKIYGFVSSAYIKIIK